MKKKIPFPSFKPFRSPRSRPATLKLLSTALIVMLLSSTISFWPGSSGTEMALAQEGEGSVKLVLELIHAGIFIAEVADFGAETAYEHIASDPSDELLEEIEMQGELIDEVQEGLDEIQADLADMFQELNLYDCMQNAWNTIPNLVNWYNRLNYDIGDKERGEVDPAQIEQWSDAVLDSNNIDVSIAQWYTALVQGGIGADQRPVLLQMRDFALDELNGNSVQSDFSTTVESTNGVGIVTERPMYFNYNDVWNGGSTQSGIDDPGTTFFFSEGTVRPGFSSYFCIQNPRDEIATVRIDYMKGDGSTTEQHIIIPPLCRSTVSVNAFFGAVDGSGADFSAKVESTGGTDIVAERAMYFNYGDGWDGGHVNAGVRQPSTSMFFAEGTTRPGFDSFLCLQNPETTDAEVAITYMKGDGSNQAQSLVVPPHSRYTVKVNDVIGQEDSEACDFSAKVECVNGVGIVGERPMYFSYRDGWTGGHCQNGSTGLSTTQYFAEGTVRPSFDSYICIQNPGGETADVTVTYMKGDGSNQAQSISVAPYSRGTINVKEVLGEAEDDAHDFSAKVECTNGQGILAERPSYFNYRSKWTGGHDEAGVSYPEGKFYFAEGTVRPNFDSYICIQNPEGRDADVKITFMKGDGSTQQALVKVPAMSRYTMNVGDTYEGSTLTDAYERYLASFFEECLYYQVIGAASQCNALDYEVPKTSSYWLQNTYKGKYMKEETDLFMSCVEQLVMAAANNGSYNWNADQHYLSLPAEADEIFASADLLRRIALGETELPDSGNVVNAGICGRVVSSEDAVAKNTIPTVKVQASGGGTQYSATTSQAGSIQWLSKAGAQQKYDTWSGSGTAIRTLGLSTNWSTPKFQFDPDTTGGHWPDGTYSIIGPSGSAIGTAKVEQTAFTDPTDGSNTLYLSYGHFTSTLRNSRLSCDAAQWAATSADDGSLTSKISSSFAEDLNAGKMGIWLFTGTVKDTYFKRTYTFTSNSFSVAADLQVKFQEGLNFNLQSSSGHQKYAYGYVWSDFDWYKNTAHGYMKYDIHLYDKTANSTIALTSDDANAHSDSGHYTCQDDFGKSTLTNYNTITLTKGHEYKFVVTFYGYIDCDDGGVSDGGEAEVNQLIRLSTMGVMAP